MATMESSREQVDNGGGLARERLIEERLAYRPAELAAMVGLSAKAIYRAIERGELEAARVANGSRLLVPAAAAEEWLLTNAVSPKRGESPPARPGRRSTGHPLGEALAQLDGVSDAG